MRRVDESPGREAARGSVEWASCETSREVSPVGFLRAFPDEHQFLWSRGSTGEAIAAVGRVVGWRACGPGRFGDVAAAMRHAFAGSTGPGADHALAVGGFAFDENHVEGADWQGFPATDWLFPRLALVRRAGVTRLVAAAASCESSGNPSGTARSVAEAALRRLATGPDRSGVAPTSAGSSARFEIAAASSADDWRGAVESLLARIAAGSLDKLVLARAIRVFSERVFDPLRVVERLAEAHPDCATFAVRRGPATLVGATPERLVRVRQHGVDVSVLAGTARRGESRTDDRARGLALLAAAKERHEHALVLSAVRDALGPLCARVSSPESPRLLRTQAVQHLWTPVRGVLRPEAGLFDCVAALHPTPAVCGTPRETARSLIESSEGRARGWWSGGVGWSDGRGGEVSVVLRSALLRDREALLCAGAGIVAGSRWEDELEETRLKLRPMLAALVEV